MYRDNWHSGLFLTWTSGKLTSMILGATWSTALLLLAEYTNMFQSFRSTTWSNLQLEVAGWTGNKMQRDSLKNNCPPILAASSSLSTTAVPPICLKNLKAGRRIIAWSGPTIMLWLAVCPPILSFRATLSLDVFKKSHYHLLSVMGPTGVGKSTVCSYDVI